MELSFLAKCFIFVKVLEILADIGSFICVIIIVSISSKNSFKSHIIGNIERYYSYPSAYNETSALVNSMNDNIIIDETLLKKKMFDDNLSNEVEDIDKSSPSIFNYKKFLKRKLESDSFCGDMFNSFVKNNGRKLSYIFDLNYETIYGISLALFIVTLLFVALTILYIFCKKKMNECVLNIFAIIGILLWITKFVLFILLFHYIENGDIEKYDDFLDCKYVRTKYFKKFNDVEKLRKCFIAFTVFNLLSEIFDRAEKLVEAGSKELEENESIKSI